MRLERDQILRGVGLAQRDVAEERENEGRILARYGAEIRAAQIPARDEIVAELIWRESRGNPNARAGGRLDEVGLVQISRDEAREAGLPLEARTDPGRALRAFGALSRKYVRAIPGCDANDEARELCVQLRHSLGPGALRDLISLADGELSVRALDRWMQRGEYTRRMAPAGAVTMVRRVARAGLRTRPSWRPTILD